VSDPAKSQPPAGMGEGVGASAGREPFRQVTIIGARLIGTSLAMALRSRGHAHSVVLSDRDQDVLAEAQALGRADRYVGEAADAVRGADLIILAVPVRASGAVAAIIAEHLEENAIVTDVGSVKAHVIETVSAALRPGQPFVAGHPIAGAERSGPAAGFATLFDGRWSILTPHEGAPQWAVARLTWLWEGLGSTVSIMDAAHHDRVLAITSHLPHLIAFNIVGTAADLEAVTRSEVIKFSAGGFRDFTRIAASDPVMWRDVFLSNQDAVLEMLGRFSEDLSALQRAIRWGDGAALEELFTRTRAIRRDVIEAGQEVDAPDFGRRQVASTASESKAIFGPAAPQKGSPGEHASQHASELPSAHGGEQTSAHAKRQKARGDD